MIMKKIIIIFIIISSLLLSFLNCTSKETTKVEEEQSVENTSDKDNSQESKTTNNKSEMDSEQGEEQNKVIEEELSEKIELDLSEEERYSHNNSLIRLNIEFTRIALRKFNWKKNNRNYIIIGLYAYVKRPTREKLVEFIDSYFPFFIEDLTMKIRDIQYDLVYAEIKNDYETLNAMVSFSDLIKYTLNEISKDELINRINFSRKQSQEKEL